MINREKNWLKANFWQLNHFSCEKNCSCIALKLSCSRTSLSLGSLGGGSIKSSNCLKCYWASHKRFRLETIRWRDAMLLKSQMIPSPLNCHRWLAITWLTTRNLTNLIMTEWSDGVLSGREQPRQASPDIFDLIKKEYLGSLLFCWALGSGCSTVVEYMSNDCGY